MLTSTPCASWQATNLAKSGKSSVFFILDALGVDRVLWRSGLIIIERIVRSAFYSVVRIED